MAEMSIRKIDDAAYARLKARAKAEHTTAEALARNAIHKAAGLTGQEKRALALEMQRKFKAAETPGAKQTPGWVLIRESRDER